MKLKHLVLPIIIVVSFFSSGVSAIQVTIDRDNLSTPSKNLAIVWLYSSAGGRTHIASTQTIDLADGTYKLSATAVSPYGEVIVENNMVTSTTGALIFDGITKTLSFDLSKLAKTTIRFSDIDLGRNRILFALEGISGIIRGTQTFYLPDGNYNVAFRGAGSIFGTINIINNIITTDQYLVEDSNGDIAFNLNALATVNFERGNELMLLTGIREVGDGTSYTPYTIHFTPGTYSVLTRGNLDYFGTVIIDENMSISTTKHLLIDATTNTVSFDIENIPKVTIAFEQLSDSVSGRPVASSAVFELFGGGYNHSGLFPKDSDFYIHASGDKRKNRYGEFAIDNNGNVTTTGYLTVDSVVIEENNRIHSTIGFKRCELNSVSIELVNPTERYWFHPHYVMHETSTVFLPNGTYPLFSDNARKISFTVDDEGIVINENDGNFVSLTYNPTSCVPPDEDGDKVMDSLDICPATTTDVVVDGDGCSVSQSIEIECSAWKAKSHGKFVSCVTRVVNRKASDGLINNNEKTEFINEAAKNKEHQY